VPSLVNLGVPTCKELAFYFKTHRLCYSDLGFYRGETEFDITLRSTYFEEKICLLRTNVEYMSRGSELARRSQQQGAPVNTDHLGEILHTSFSCLSRE
jgi:hypothetical protein